MTTIAAVIATKVQKKGSEKEPFLLPKKGLEKQNGKETENEID